MGYCKHESKLALRSAEIQPCHCSICSTSTWGSEPPLPFGGGGRGPAAAHDPLALALAHRPRAADATPEPEGQRPFKFPSSDWGRSQGSVTSVPLIVGGGKVSLRTFATFSRRKTTSTILYPPSSPPFPHGCTHTSPPPPPATHAGALTPARPHHLPPMPPHAAMPRAIPHPSSIHTCGVWAVQGSATA